MTHFIYLDEREVFSGRPVPYARQDAVKHWSRHYANYKFLSFIETRSDDFAERAQARKEIAICQKKMEHWRKHANWTAEAGAVARAREDLRWQESRRTST
jgi:hypothetical protein